MSQFLWLLAFAGAIGGYLYVTETWPFAPAPADRKKNKDVGEIGTKGSPARAKRAGPFGKR